MTHIKTSYYLDRLERVRQDKERVLNRFSVLSDLDIVGIVRRAIGDWNGKKFTKHFQNRVDKEAEKVGNVRVRLLLTLERFMTVQVMTEKDGEQLKFDFTLYHVLDRALTVDTDRLITQLEKQISSEYDELKRASEMTDRVEIAGKLDRANELIDELEGLLQEVTNDGTSALVEELVNSAFITGLVKRIS